MSSTIEQIDNYLRKNKKSLYANLNKWYGEKRSNGSFILDEDAKNLKRLWEDAQNAKGINKKITAFNILKEELAHWTNPEELAKQEAELEGYGLDNWPEFADSQELDKLRFFDQLSITPETNKLDDLNIDEVYSQGYDYEQMKALADQYGYDYTDKEDRKEFLDKLSKYQQEKDLEKIWNGDIYTSLFTPLAKEYAKNNWQNIDSDDYIGTQGPKLPLVGNVGFGIPTNAKMFGTVAADAGVNTLMAGIPGGALSKAGLREGGQAVVNNTVAPIARAGFKVAINDEPFEDASKDALNEIATNFAFRFGMRGAQRYSKEIDKYLNKAKGKGAVQERMNTKANARRGIEQTTHYQLDRGEGAQNLGQPRYDYFKIDSKGNKIKSNYKDWSNDPNRQAMSIDELDELTSGIDPRYFSQTEKNLDEAYKAIKDWRWKDAFEALKQKKPKLSDRTVQAIRSDIENAGTIPENMTEAELMSMGVPKESFWNFAMNNPVTNDAVSYINNLQGRSKWGGAALGALANYDPTQTISQKTFEKKPKLSKQDQAELELLQRLRDLHAKNPEFFKAPKIPDKFKDYFNEDQAQQWNENVRITDIFN